MSFYPEKTNSSNMTGEQDYDSKFKNYYNSIVEKHNKTTNTSSRKLIGLKWIKSQNNIKSDRSEKQSALQTNRTDKYEIPKNSFIFKKVKKHTIHRLFNNLLIREKQETNRNIPIKVNDYVMNIKKEENDKSQIIVKDKSSLFKTFFNQTKSNFNNKYKVIYSISSWREKNKIKSLLKTIKSYQNKSNFYDYLKLNILKRCSLSKKALEKMKSKISDDNDSKNKIELYNNSSNDYLNEIIHRNHLIKIRTIYNIKIKSNELRKSNSEIFDKNNTFFQTMPIKKLKSHNQKSFS